MFLIFTDSTDIYTYVCTSMYTYVHIHMCMSKLIKLYALNMCTSFYANYTLIKFKKKEYPEEKQPSPFRTVHSHCIAVTPIKVARDLNRGWKIQWLNSQASSCLTCQQRLMQLITPKSLLLVFPSPWSCRRTLGSVLGFLVTLSTQCSLLGVLIHFHDFKTPVDCLMTQKFISLPGAVPLYPGHLNAPACLLACLHVLQA